jgi:hypothetical protein
MAGGCHEHAAYLARLVWSGASSAAPARSSQMETVPSAQAGGRGSTPVLGPLPPVATPAGPRKATAITADWGQGRAVPGSAHHPFWRFRCVKP